MTLRFVTTNRNKLREVAELLRRPVTGVELALDELQSTDLEQIVRAKAALAFRHVGGPVIVEDTALVFLAWGALPGPFIKFFLEEMGLSTLVDALAPSDNWEARAVCGVGYHDSEQVHYFEGRVSGEIVPPQGEQGFGWDPIFRPHGSDRTFAEMPRQEKHRYSMRAIAMKALARHLDSLPASAPAGSAAGEAPPAGE